MPSIVRADDPGDAARIGGKAAALAALRAAGVPIPDWFVVAPDGPAGEPVSSLARAGEGLAAMRAELERALAALCPWGERVAVRSSARDEDGAQRSFAGQLDSFLFVPPGEVAERVADVWRSALGARVLAYRREHGLDPTLFAAPGVLVQRMVAADVAGVAFSADPVSGRRGVVVVSAVYGLGTALVSGEHDGDEYRVDSGGAIIARTIAAKRSAHRYAPGTVEGVLPDAVAPALAAQPALRDEQVRQVAALARRCERHFGRPQDIEWAIEGDQLYLLQSRPITSLAHLADPDGAYNLWDNSNIAESYAGVTTPLTFSFARYVYETVYRQLCRVMGVPAATIARHDDTFRHMLGLIRGRVYYNLLSWYRLLALMPGFTLNRTFMEQMMGVKEGLPASVTAELSAPTWRDRLRDGRLLLAALGGLALNYLLLPRRIRRFYHRIDQALAAAAADLPALRADELVAYYRDLERQLITRWDAPLINDLFAMIFYGLLRRLATTWCGDSQGTLQNDLLCGEGGMISAEPATRVRAMATIAAGDPELVATLCAAPLPAILRALRAHPALDAEYQAYLDTFADRCLEELKLESPTLRDDPLPLLRSVGQLAQRRGAAPMTGGEPAAHDAQVRQQAVRRVAVALRAHPVRRALFHWVLGAARTHVRDRENLRFERTRVFGRVRLIVVELGRRFAALDLLDDPRAIFYLELGEILGFVDGTATSADLKGLAALRQAEFARYRALESPSDRFETRGIVAHAQTYRGMPSVQEPTGERRTGVAACPGTVRGPVRVIVEPRGAHLCAGEILVAERTDPGWIMLFPSAAGVLVERGSLLSHSAIVARELGIPTVVGLTGATRWLRDGDWVELDGSTGVVTRIAPPAEGDGHA
jgi:phosphohistidine swiveling domain-containing protein